MITMPGMLMIGAATRNAGKTELASRLIKKYRHDIPIVAIKVTVIGATDQGCPRGGKGCGVCGSLKGKFNLTEEIDGPEGKDTTRLKNAGAEKVFWLRVRQPSADKALEALIDTVGIDAVCICESNRLRLSVEPGGFIVTSNSHAREDKPSAASVIEFADELIAFDGANFDIDLSAISLNDNTWSISRRATAIVLAGGDSVRMGVDKTLLPIRGRPLIEHIVRQLDPRFNEVLVSARDPDKYAFLNVKTVPDSLPGQGPLVGIVSAIQASANDLNFVIACDIPEIDLNILRKMLNSAQDCDVVVPTTREARREPLFAIYRKTALPAMIDVLQEGERKIDRAFPRFKTKYLPLDHTDWLRNLNSMQDYTDYTNHRSQRS